MKNTLIYIAKFAAFTIGGIYAVYGTLFYFVTQALKGTPHY